MPKTLRTDTSVFTAVFRRIVQQLETDTEVVRVIGVNNLRSWKGVPGDKAPMEPSGISPVVRLTPNPQDVTWFSPDAQWGTLHVRVEMVVETLCVDDVTDLWDVLVRAIRPASRSIVPGNPNFARDLVGLGADTGEIVFSDPAVDPRPEAQPEGRFLAEGRFHLTVLRAVAF